MSPPRAAVFRLYLIPLILCKTQRVISGRGKHSQGKGEVTSDMVPTAGSNYGPEWGWGWEGSRGVRR